MMFMIIATKSVEGVLQKLIVAQLINSPPFMKPEGSLPCSQEPANGPHPTPDELSLRYPVFFRFILICFHLHLGLQSVLFTSGFPTKIL
jgi:hypothetical protein